MATQPTESASRQQSERGAALIEFAIVLPLFMLLLVGMIEFGRGYYLKSTLTHASREGARAAAVGHADPTQVTLDAAAALDPALATITIAPTPCVAGSPVSVTVSYPFDYSIPFFRDDSITLSETGTMRCGG